MDLDVQLAAGGDMAAFERLYQVHHRRVYSLCLRMTRNVSDAEDLTQNVFIQVFRKLTMFRGDSSFSTWLHRLTVNEVLMHFRKPVVRKERTSVDEEAPRLLLHGSNDRVRLIDRVALNEAIRKLSPGYRQVLILHDIGGYEHQQIARMLGCAVGTSKSQLHKARMKLRKLLKVRSTESLAKITRETIGALTRDTDVNAAGPQLTVASPR
jgi:RNA polymerase sigma-70 factor, ECF subfamily